MINLGSMINYVASDDGRQRTEEMERLPPMSHSRFCSLASMLVLVPLLLMVVACASVTGSTGGADKPDSKVAIVRVSGSGTALPLAEKLAEAYGHDHPEIEFRFDSGTNSGGAIEGVLGGTLDLAVANRPLSEDEADEPLDYRPFARDAVAFATRHEGEVEGLTTDQVRDVYGGALTDWKQLGGSAAPIVVLDRDEDESARKLVLLPLMDGRPVEARTVVLNKANEMLEAMESTPDSLGYSSLGLLRERDIPGERVLKLDGVVPSPEAVARREYPWYLTFGLVHAADAPRAVRDFADFATGPEGRKLVEKNGYAKP